MRRAAESSPVFRGSLLGEDGTTTGIAIQPVDMPELEFNQLGIDEQIQRIAREELADSPDVQIWLVGSAHLKAETSRFLLRDLSRVIPLAFALIMLIALLSFRSLRGLLIPLSTIGIAVIWTFAVMAEVNPALNLVTISIPPLLLVIGFVESVHIVSCYYEAIEEGAGASDLGERGLARARGGGASDVPHGQHHGGRIPLAGHQPARGDPRVRPLRRDRHHLHHAGLADLCPGGAAAAPGARSDRAQTAPHRLRPHARPARRVRLPPRRDGSSSGPPCSP